jgi:hypothetical protein
MKKLTNYAPGPRGITLKSGDIVWIEPGKTAEVDPKEIVEPLPDLGNKVDMADDGDADLIASVQAENADLKDQVKKLTADLAKATKA